MFLLLLLEYSLLLILPLACAHQLPDLLTYDNLHNESCYTDFNCPNEMRCEKDIHLCVCIDGFIFSNNVAMCELSKKFDKFWIQGPSTIYLSQKEVYFDLHFNQYEAQYRSNWTYEWIIKSGNDCAIFSGINTKALKMRILKPGFISFAISISNSTSFGYKQHNLTIYDQDLFPIANVENLTITLPSNYAVLNAEKSNNAKYYKWIPEDDLPAEMLSGSSLNDSKLFIFNLVPGVFQFYLSVWNDHSPINNTKIVQLSVFGGIAEENLIELLSSFTNFTFKYSNELSKEIEQILEQSTNSNRLLVKFTKISSDASLLGNVFTSFYFYVVKDSKNKDCRKCSGHGKCDNLTKTCVCDDFWMPNIFVKMIHNGRNMDCCTILLQHNNQIPSKQIGRFSPVRMSKRKRGDCLSEFRRMFVEYSEQFGITHLKNENESICLKELDDSSSSE
uniref:Protein kinase domain-containing protein n=1 Tax=Meloidogyne hapla TaxID=6305 RepID=A0A1I8AWX2_MELHA